MELKLSSSSSFSPSSSSSSLPSPPPSFPCRYRPWPMVKNPRNPCFLSSPPFQNPPKLESYGHRKILKITRAITTETPSPVADSSLLPAARKLVLLRHGKSSWSDPSIKDHDRPLNEYGRSASANLATKLYSVGWLPDLILCSDSSRTRETLEIMQEQIPELQNVEVHFLGSFYSVSAMDGQTAQHLQETICKYARDDISTIICGFYKVYGS